MRQLAALALLLAVNACAKEEAPKPSPEAPAATAASSTAEPLEKPPMPATAPTVEVEDHLLSVEEDFEQEAAQEISPTNLEAELNRLEQEINAPLPKTEPAGKPPPPR